MTEKIRRRDMNLLLASIALGAVACEERKPSAAGLTSAKKTVEKDAPKGPPGVTKDSIKVGTWGPLSGPAAVWAPVVYGVEAYFKFLNAKGGIHGRKLELVFRDDQYNPSKTPPAVRELVEKEKVFALLGGVGTANGRSVSDYLAKAGVPLFSPASGDKYWGSGKAKNVFTVFPRYLTEGEIIGAYVAKELKAKKIAVLYQNDDFGKQGLEGVKNGAKKNGGEIVAEVSCLPTDTDLSGHASKLSEKKPDVLVLYCGPKQGITVVKTLEAQKKKPQVVTSFVLSDPILFKLAGDSWEGVITAAASKLPDSDDPAVLAYKKVLKEHGDPKKTPPGTFTMAAFLWAQPFAEALHRAGKDLDRAKFLKAVEGLEDWNSGGPHWTAGALGPKINFGPDKHQGVDQVFLAKAEGGKWKKITEWLKVE